MKDDVDVIRRQHLFMMKKAESVLIVDVISKRFYLFFTCYN